MPVSAATKFKKTLAEKIQKNRKALTDWHASQSAKAPPPFYCSVDLRDSGHKIAPVDSNLYPAGFNNICPADQQAAPPIFRAQISQMAGEKVHRVLILPESHTTNAYYAENLYYLNEILQNAGFDVKMGWYGEAQGPVTLKSATQKELTAYPIRVEGGRMRAEGFEPEAIILNNDFSSGYPRLLDDVKQPILPSHRMGWHSRKKSTHFKHYNALAAEFAQIVDIDPWSIQIDTEEVDHVDFNEGQGVDQVEAAVARVLERTRAAYDRHKIDRKPFVFVKNNSGTYGMGIMVVHSAEELRQMNRRTKNKMSVGKGKLKIESVAVQEGVPTATLVDRLAAEPVIYLVGCSLIGGFLRTNTEKGDEENLNSQGMVFKKLCMSDLQTSGDPEDEDLKKEPVLELVYGSIARISALATGREMAEIKLN